MLKIVFKTCKNETLMTSYSHFTKFFSRKILKHFIQDRSTSYDSTYVERSQPGLMYRQKPTERQSEGPFSLLSSSLEVTRAVAGGPRPRPAPRRARRKSVFSGLFDL